jgi:hypothetical protein
MNSITIDSIQAISLMLTVSAMHIRSKNIKGNDHNAEDLQPKILPMEDVKMTLMYMESLG